MVLPFPKRIPLYAVVLFGAVLTVVLLAEGNSAVVSVCVLALVLVGSLGFNLGEGFHNPTGSYIFFVVFFTGLLGTIVKAVTGEPLLSNVPNADKTLTVYLLGTCGTVLAAYLSRRIAPRKPFLAGRLTQANSGC